MRTRTLYSRASTEATIAALRERYPDQPLSQLVERGLALLLAEAGGTPTADAELTALMARLDRLKARLARETHREVGLDRDKEARR